MKSLETDRLLLRPWEEADRDPFARMNADPRIAEFLPTPLSKIQSDALIDRFQQHLEEHGYGVWAVEMKEEKTLIGMAGLMHVSGEFTFAPAVEIQWRIDVDHWGKGYATEAAQRALTFAFDELGLDEVIAMTVPDNTRSCRVMKKLGMQQDKRGSFEHPLLPKGHPLRPHVLYKIHQK